MVRKLISIVNGKKNSKRNLLNSRNRIKIYAVGDVCLGDYNMCVGFGVRSVVKQKGSLYLFDEIRTQFSDGDIVFGNLECVLSDQNLNHNLESMVMRGSADAVEGLAHAGFNVLNVANNHIMQHGRISFIETCELLKKNNITVVGRAGDAGFCCKPAFLNIGDIKIGFLGYAFEKDKYSEQPLYAIGSEEDVLNDIAQLKKQADLIIVSCHWGLELLSTPSRNIICLAHKMVGQGADIILGHHPHVVQGVEIYNGKIICYSLGNFIFDLPFSPCRKSCIASIVVDDRHNMKYDLIPISVGHDYVPRFVQNKQQKVKFEKYFLELNKNLQKMMSNASEEEMLKYYSNFYQLRRKERIAVLINLLKNMHKMKVKILWQLILKKIFFYFTLAQVKLRAYF